MCAGIQPTLTSWPVRLLAFRPCPYRIMHKRIISAFFPLGEWRSKTRVTIDVTHFQNLQCLALRDVGPCRLALPDGCLLHVQSRSSACFLPVQSWHISSAALDRQFVGNVEPIEDRLHTILQRISDIRELTIDPAPMMGSSVMALDAAALSLVKNLTLLRVLHTPSRYGEIRLMLPSFLKLHSLVLVARTVRLGFECVESSAGLLDDMKITSACLHYIPAEPHGMRCLEEEVAPYLRDGLSLGHGSVGVVEGLPGVGDEQVYGCVYLRKSGSAEMLAADLLPTRCLCRCCFACLKQDGKLLPAS